MQPCVWSMRSRTTSPEGVSDRDESPTGFPPWSTAWSRIGSVSCCVVAVWPVCGVPVFFFLFVYIVCYDAPRLFSFNFFDVCFPRIIVLINWLFEHLSVCIFTLYDIKTDRTRQNVQSPGILQGLSYERSTSTIRQLHTQVRIQAVPSESEQAKSPYL